MCPEGIRKSRESSTVFVCVLPVYTKKKKKKEERRRRRKKEEQTKNRRRGRRRRKNIERRKAKTVGQLTLFFCHLGPCMRNQVCGNFSNSPALCKMSVSILIVPQNPFLLFVKGLLGITVSLSLQLFSQALLSSVKLPLMYSSTKGLLFGMLVPGIMLLFFFIILVQYSLLACPLLLFACQILYCDQSAVPHLQHVFQSFFVLHVI